MLVMTVCVFVHFVLLVVGCCGLTSIPLYGGAESGEYTLPISVGTPTQELVVRVTTYHPVLLIPSPLCSKCKNHYLHHNSSTYQQIPCNTSLNCDCVGNTTQQCGYRAIYGGVTVLGIATSDRVQFNSYSKNYTFVRFDNLPPELVGSTADGIFGLSQWKPRYEGEHLLPQVAQISNTTDFSLCLGEFGGMLVLGGYDPQYVGDAITYAPIITSNDTNANFTLQLSNLQINKHSIWDWFNTTTQLAEDKCTNCVTAIIDSGTQYLQLPAAAYNAAKSVFQQLMCSSGNTIGICGSPNFFDGNCFILDDTTIEQFPIIELTLYGNVTLRIPPTNYFVDYGGKACLALDISKDNQLVIGNRIMQEYYTIFEPSNGRIGFTKAVNCSGAQYSLHIVSGNSQNGVVGRRLSDPLVVKVTRLNDSMPVAGINVTFNVVDASFGWEVMWISHAILKGQRARVEPSIVTTKADGTAEVFLRLAGVADQTIVTADTPLCLSHVVFTATGQQSYVWRAITYFFLFLFVIALIMLNFWYNKLTRRRKLYKSSSDRHTNSLLINASENDDGSSNPSPTDMPAHPEFNGNRKKDNQELQSVNDIDEEDEDPFQMANRKWYQNIRRNFNWHMWRLSRRFYNQKK